MPSVMYTENGLNVEYISDFIEKSHADRYMAELRTLPFYRPTFRIRGKEAKPKRLMLAHGDTNTSYAFSGTSLPANPWTPLTIELRDKVEKETACTFNYVLLNLYKDGNDFISHHKDNETCLNVNFPIAVLSFGGKRTIEFKRSNVPSTFIELEHGSFYSISKPSNELFTHGIAPEPDNKDMRISLTFRHLIIHPLDLKKPKLNLDSVNLKHLSPLNRHCSPLNRPDHLSPLNNPGPVDDIPSKDWLTRMFQEMDTIDPLLKQWNITSSDRVIASWDLKQNVFLQLVLEKNFSVKLHIRNFKEFNGGELFPSKQGVVMTPITFAHFQKQIRKFNFHSVGDSFLSNNMLLTAFIDEESCLLQQIFYSMSKGFYFKPCGIKLFQEQIFQLLENIQDIKQTLIKSMFTLQLPTLIMKNSFECDNHITEAKAKDKFLNCVFEELNACTNSTFECDACEIGDPSQFNHACVMKSTLEKFQLNQDFIFLNVNIYNIAKNTIDCCLCHYKKTFFEQFPSVQSFVTLFENYLLEEKFEIFKENL